MKPPAQSQFRPRRSPAYCIHCLPFLFLIWSATFHRTVSLAAPGEFEATRDHLFDFFPRSADPPKWVRVADDVSGRCRFPADFRFPSWRFDYIKGNARSCAEHCAGGGAYWVCAEACRALPSLSSPLPCGGCEEPATKETCNSVAPVGTATRHNETEDDYQGFHLCACHHEPPHIPGRESMALLGAEIIQVLGERRGVRDEEKLKDEFSANLSCEVLLHKNNMNELLRSVRTSKQVG